jgi:hypothetical protein
MSDPDTDEQRIAAELSSTVDADVDPEVLRNGGPTRTPGMMTTTGGTAGPNSAKPRPYRPEGVKIAPTTTGDATTGGMDTPIRSSTSDASTTAVGGFTDEDRRSELESLDQDRRQG